MRVVEFIFGNYLDPGNLCQRITKVHDLALFVLAVNSGIRCGDLLRLRVGQVRHLSPGDALRIVEGKTQKANTLVINQASYDALRSYIHKVAPTDDAFLFSSRKGQGAITIQQVNRLVKKWCRTIGLKGNFGAHSLRKSFGFLQRTVFAVPFEVLCKRFNHASPSVTQRYLGVQDAEVSQILLNQI